MNAAAAHEIRRGILRARAVIRRERPAPPLTETELAGGMDVKSLPLWERAYHHEYLAAIRDGRLMPPRDPGASNVRSIA